MSRRRLLIGGGAALFVLAGCGGEDGGEAPAATGGSGPWEFTDDRGKKATRESRPTKIVAQLSAAATLWDLGIRPVGTWGDTKDMTARKGNVDTDAVTWVGQTWGDFNIEKLASLTPDLLVAPMQTKDQLWYVPEDAVAKIEPLCPTVGINQFEVPVDKVISRFAELATSLGADLNASAVTSAKTEFEAAGTALGEAVKAKPGLRVAFVSGTKENLYLGNAKIFSDLAYLQNLGVNFVQPTVPANEPHWEVLSWEQAGKYPIDVLLYDSRNPSYFTTDLSRYPTVANLPAVKANQAISWNPETPSTWAAFGAAMRDLTGKLSACKTVA
ncbi:ABC transporter substrate-binding protein [Phytohabitans sp. ZYX-F-186]|uniref:ABC transporter substrate-binding protein n=1 Tax=Phytohabitans maris TaxID=3071409 RepID=A0ABU0ZL03_9ACTN|nr:ABC transporter substrate-binding protein [Phytohabitans sp. ZYX-F-186]MDQ7907724.1 ABC transporter substrate-binding protein [Phytohabitans sp. ZYX-F-186]